MLAIHRTATGVGGYGCEEGGVRNAEPHFFPFHVAAGMQGARILIYPGEQRIPPCLSPVRRRHSYEKEKCHRSPHRPAMTLGPRHTAERIREARGNRENQHQLEEVRKGSRIFERVGAIGTKKSAAIRAKFFDDFLRCHGALGNNLLRHSLRNDLAICSDHLHSLGFDQLHRGVRFQVLNDTLRHEHQRAYDANWQQNP